MVLGQTAETPPASCPGKIVNNVEITPCRVEGHVTGFQAVAGGVARPYEAPFEGKIVAWSITLAKPSTVETPTTSNEVGFFDEFLGKPSEARIGILRPVEGSKPPQYTLVRQSPLEVLNPYFGTTPIFALEHPLTVLQGQIVALTIPTWAPMFAFNVDADNTWRGSRLPEHCASKEDIQGGHPQQGVGKTKTYGCYYSQRAAALHGDSGQETVGPVAGWASGAPPHSPDLAGSPDGRPRLPLGQRRKTFGGAPGPTSRISRAS